MEPQRFCFFFSELEHKIVRKASRIALDGFVKIFGLYLIKLRQMSIKHNPMPTHRKNMTFDNFQRRGNRFHSLFLALRLRVVKHWKSQIVTSNYTAFP